MKNKGWIILALAGIGAYVLYQRTAQAREGDAAFNTMALEEQRQRQIALMRAQGMHMSERAGVVEVGPATVRPASSSYDVYVTTPSTKYGPVMVP